MIGKQVNSALESEFQAILMTMQHAWSRGFKKLITERDSKKEIDILNNKLLHFDAYNGIREIMWWQQKFEDIQYVWTSRRGNQVADTLTKQGFQQQLLFEYYFYVPGFITNALHKDFVNSS